MTPQGESGPAALSTGAVVIVSPHFDDAVLSCGHLLATRPGSHVVTVFSGGPRRVVRLPDWDRMSRVFSPGDDVMGIRRREDDDALAVLGARGHRLGLRDSQYGPGWAALRGRTQFLRGVAPAVDPRQAVAARLRQMVSALDVPVWLVPLGLLHRDHAVAAQGCLAVAEHAPSITWVAYEELPYGAERPELVQSALTALHAGGWRTEPVDLGAAVDEARKRAAVACYRSQCNALGDRVEVALGRPEAFHRLWRATNGHG